MNPFHILDTCRESQEDRAKRVADRARFSAEPATLTGWGDDMFPAPKRAPLDFARIARDLSSCDCCGKPGVLELAISSSGVEAYACEECRGQPLTAEMRDEFERDEHDDFARDDRRERGDL